MRQHKFRGFTSIELMVVVSVVAILAALAAPSFRDLVASQRIKTASYDLVAALSQVRSEAIKRNTSVALTKAAGGWQNGWTATVVSTSLVINKHDAFSGLTISDPGSVTYGTDGRVTASASFQISSSVVSGSTARCVTISLSGLPATKTGSC